MLRAFEVIPLLLCAAWAAHVAAFHGFKPGCLKIWAGVKTMFNYSRFDSRKLFDQVRSDPVGRIQLQALSDADAILQAEALSAASSFIICSLYKQGSLNSLFRGLSLLPVTDSATPFASVFAAAIKSPEFTQIEYPASYQRATFVTPREHPGIAEIVEEFAPEQLLMAKLLDTGRRQWPYFCSLVAGDKEVRDQCWKQLALAVFGLFTFLLAGTSVDKVGWGFVVGGGTSFAITVAAEKTIVKTEVFWVLLFWFGAMFIFGVVWTVNH